jgi:hypothetical protein
MNAAHKTKRDTLTKYEANKYFIHPHITYSCSLLMRRIIWQISIFDLIFLTDLSDYFRVKHVVNDGHVRRQLLSKNISDDDKMSILTRYVQKEVLFTPLNGVTEKKPWRMALSGKTGVTYILADQRTITRGFRDVRSKQDGADTHGNPVWESASTFPMLPKLKFKFDKDFNFSKLEFANKARPLPTSQGLRISFNKEGKIHHFESQNKPKSGS